MLKENGALVNLKPNWSVLDMSDSERVMDLSSKAFNIYPAQAKDLNQLYSYARNSMTDWSKLVKHLVFQIFLIRQILERL